MVKVKKSVKGGTKVRDGVVGMQHGLALAFSKNPAVCSSLLLLLQVKAPLNETDDERVIRIQMEALAAEEQGRKDQVRNTEHTHEWQHPPAPWNQQIPT
jgi:hypothetical protein